jgi:hypothetical protein
MPDPSGQHTDTDHYLVVEKVRERLTMSKKQRTDFTWKGSSSRN